MLEKLRGSIGRKLLSLIVTPILTALLIAGNALLPDGSRLTPEQITEIVTYLIGLVAAFIFTQGTADAIKETRVNKTPAPALDMPRGTGGIAPPPPGYDPMAHI